MKRKIVISGTQNFILMNCLSKKGEKTMKNNKSAAENRELMDYITFIEKNPEEKKKLNSAINREVKKLQKNKDTEFAAMFLSSIRF